MNSTAVAPGRILMTADTLGGVWSYSVLLARGLAEVGVEVHLASLGRPADDQQRREAAEAQVVLHENACRLEWMEDPWADVDRCGRWLLALEDDVRPELVHLGGYTHGALPFRAPVLVVGHSCVLSWWRAVWGGDPPPEWATYQRRVAAGLASADGVVAPSRTMLDALRRHYPGMTHRRWVVPNGIVPRRASRVRRPVVLAAGRLWDEAKNVSAVAGAAAALPWPVEVAGEDARPGGGSVALPGVRSLGRLSPPALAARMAEAEIFVHPARYEPFGLAPLEAASSGCALVLGDIPSLREVWGHAAVFVGPEPRQVANGVLGLIEDGARRLDLRLRAKARADRFNQRRMVRGYLEVYANLLRRAARRRRAPHRLEG